MFWRDRKRTAGAPLGNTYWVQPNRLLAGEHPGGATPAETLERLRGLLALGVNSFIDLTEAGEMPDYEPLFLDLDAHDVRYRRLPVLDHSVPQSSAHMSQIVDAIDAELGSQRVVYVHCRAGIGRTGMAIGCHLIRGGLTNEAALEQLQALWRHSARARRWPSIPETEEQVRFVRQWLDTTRSGAPASDLSARIEGALFGLAVGEMLGEHAARNALQALERSSAPIPFAAHTATTYAALRSLHERGEHDPSDQMERYRHWLRTHDHLAAPAELKRALAAWQWSKKPIAGAHDPKNVEPHTLPRALAAALFIHEPPAAAIELAVDLARTTQQSPVVLDFCRFWAALFCDALMGADRAALLELRGPAVQALRSRKLKPPVQALLDQGGDAAAGATDSLSITQAARNDFASGATLRDSLSRAAQRRSAPAAMALCGALCGLHYGVEAIPLDWRQRIMEGAELRELARSLVG